MAFAIQDRVISTRNYRKHIIKGPAVTMDLYRLCGKTGQSIEHVIGGCQVLATKEYTSRHNAVAKILHQKLALNRGLHDMSVPYYQYAPLSVLENDLFKIYYDHTILTDKTVEHNWPDIAGNHLTDNSVKFTTYIIDVAIPLSSNIQSRYTDKISMYRELSDQLREVWGQEKVEIVPIVIGVTGEVHKSLQGLLE